MTDVETLKPLADSLDNYARQVAVDTVIAVNGFFD
jgi:hypothetical protein